MAVPPAEGVGGEGENDIPRLQRGQGDGVYGVPLPVAEPVLTGKAPADEGDALGRDGGEEAVLGLGQPLQSEGGTLRQQVVHSGPGQAGLKEERVVIGLRQGLLGQDGGQIHPGIVGGEVGRAVGPEGLEQEVDAEEEQDECGRDRRPEPSPPFFLYLLGHRDRRLS